MIGALDASDAHHAEARALLTRWRERDGVTLISVVTLSEVLVALRSLEGAARSGEAAAPSHTASVLEALARGRVSPTLDLDRTV